MDGQIYDGKGNLFHPNKVQAMLHKAGWRVVELDPIDNGDTSETGQKLHDVWPQGTAVQIQRQRNKM
jgi:hypothetical protein